ncbi:MAG: hypothetical protein MZV70_21880 [Desulfobacterales bacterium]|nr:hypothetical protein [Desulfobacterales bacterium]
MFGRKPAQPKSAPEAGRRAESGAGGQPGRPGRPDPAAARGPGRCARRTSCASWGSRCWPARRFTAATCRPSGVRPAAREMNRTVLFEPAVTDGESVSVSESLKHAIYPPGEGRAGDLDRPTFSPSVAPTRTTSSCPTTRYPSSTR